MNIRVKATKVKITPDVSDYLDARLRPLERYLGDVSDNARCEVEISKVGGDKQQSDHMWCAEVHIIIPGAKSMYAKNNAASIRAAIDDVKEEMERQIRKQKKAKRTVRKKVGSKVKRMLRA